MRIYWEKKLVVILTEAGGSFQEGNKLLPRPLIRGTRTILITANTNPWTICYNCLLTVGNTIYWIILKLKLNENGCVMLTFLMIEGQKTHTSIMCNNNVDEVGSIDDVLLMSWQLINRHFNVWP